MDVKDIRRTLVGKLHAIEDRKPHHVFFYLDIGGRQYRATKLSHGAKGQIDDSLVSLIAKQLRLQKQELVSLVDCALTQDEYLRLWVERG